MQSSKANRNDFYSGLQPRAVQGMLDFDFICKRKTPSVAGIIYTFGGQFVSKMYVNCQLPLSAPEKDKKDANMTKVLGNFGDAFARLPRRREGNGQAQRR
jgi:hypothetical protein